MDNNFILPESFQHSQNLSDWNLGNLLKELLCTQKVLTLYPLPKPTRDKREKILLEITNRMEIKPLESETLP